MKKLFIAAMALATIVSCSKDDAGDAILTSSKKAVAITISNGVSSTRAVTPSAPVSTGGEATIADQEQKQVAATTSELTVLFANSAGTVLQAESFNTAETTTAANIEGDANTSGVYTYTWHGVDESVTQVAVVRHATPENGFEGTNLSTYAAASVVEDLNVDLDDLELYGAADLGDNPIECTATDHNGDNYTYYLFTANVTVAPALARVEIEGIACDKEGFELGSTTLKAFQGNQVTGGYDELKLVNLTWGDPEYTYTFEDNDILKGIYEQNVGARDITNYDLGDQAIAWNVAPSATVPTLPTTEEPNNIPMVINMTADAYDYHLVNTKKTLTVGFDGIDAFQAGKIYRLDLHFGEDNLDESNEAICVTVNVTVTNWVVEEVTPEFKNN